MSIDGVHHIEPLPTFSVNTTPAFVVFHIMVVTPQFLFNEALLRRLLEPLSSYPLRNMLKNLFVSHHAIEFPLHPLFTDDTQERLQLLSLPR